MKRLYFLLCFLFALSMSAFDATVCLHLRQQYPSQNKPTTHVKQLNVPLLSPVRHTHIQPLPKIEPTDTSTKIKNLPDISSSISSSLIKQWQHELTLNYNQTTANRLNKRIDALSHKQTKTNSPPCIHQNTHAFA